MSEKQSKARFPRWVLGCSAAGCGTVVLLVALFIGWSVMGVRSITKGFSDAVELRSEIEENFGGREGYVPPADGAVPADRMEAFLAVREATQPARDEIARVFGAFPTSEDQIRELDEAPTMDKLLAAWNMTGAAFGMGGSMGDLFAARNEALVAQQMGFGEYGYIYCLAYYAMLGRDPEAGPMDSADSDVNVNVNMGMMHDGDVRDALVDGLQQQLDAVPAEDTEWRGRLEQELEALRDDRKRMPWQDGLPEAIAASLEPYRERLEATYHPAANPFELALNRKQGSMSFTTE
ncbi:hypothetical protein ABI59_15740 [Acidobacteria bacterium Mor1]|nr:hypothetical protein ABI59_15740 [Acidobacteria bacterium Mor1]